MITESTLEKLAYGMTKEEAIPQEMCIACKLKMGVCLSTKEWVEYHKSGLCPECITSLEKGIAHV